jgi:hypothetical protein
LYLIARFAASEKLISTLRRRLQRTGFATGSSSKARAVVEAMLYLRNLFHVEAGPDGRSVDYLPPAGLYLLWDTMPDKVLPDAAARGELRTAANRSAPPADARQSTPRSRSMRVL